MKGNTFSTAFENAGQRFVGQTWVRTLYLLMLRRILLDSRRSDLKATALLKLIYLEMFGHDMSWASFNVLEVMSSPKYLQKRVGYLGAVQSFRPDTEVLMLATNLLKKVISGIPVSLRVRKLNMYLGHQFSIDTNHFSTFNYVTTHHHTVSGHVSISRSVTPFVTFKPKYT